MNLKIWLWPVAVVLMVLAQWLGVVSAIIALVVYFSERTRVSLWQAVLASSVLAMVAGVGTVSLLDSVG